MRSNRRSRRSSSGTYLVIGSSTEPMRRSPMAIPTRAESTDLAIDIDVRVESWS
jgi:hypothetical protein